MRCNAQAHQAERLAAVLAKEHHHEAVQVAPDHAGQTS